MSDSPTPAPDQPKRRASARSFSLEVILAALLGLAAIATAYASYQASLRDGETIDAFNVGVAAVNEASAANNRGVQQQSADQALFIEYAKAAQDSNEDLTVYIKETLMSPNLKKAVTWWEDQDDAETPFQQGSPYVNEGKTEAAKQQVKAKASFAEARIKDKQGDDYNLVTVVLALALFLYGVAAVASSQKLAIAMTGAGVISFCIAMVMLVSV